jgi:hypothetical protein
MTHELTKEEMNLILFEGIIRLKEEFFLSIAVNIISVEEFDILRERLLVNFCGNILAEIHTFESDVVFEKIVKEFLTNVKIQAHTFREAIKSKAIKS